MKPFEIQDPKTFDSPNHDSINQTIDLFVSQDKEKFLSTYYKLSNTDKFYTLVMILCELRDIEMGKRMFLEELRPDLMNIKILNKPSNSDLPEKFGYPYRGFYQIDSIWNTIWSFKLTSKFA